jgi:hypothetical protein
MKPSRSKPQCDPYAAPEADRLRADAVRGVSKPVDLKLVSREELGSGAVAQRYEPRR